MNVIGLPRLPLRPSLPLGAGNEEIYGGWLGYSDEQISQLKSEGII